MKIAFKVLHPLSECTFDVVQFLELFWGHCHWLFEEWPCEKRKHWVLWNNYVIGCTIRIKLMATSIEACWEYMKIVISGDLHMNQKWKWKRWKEMPKVERDSRELWHMQTVYWSFKWVLLLYYPSFFNCCHSQLHVLSSIKFQVNLEGNRHRKGKERTVL